MVSGENHGFDEKYQKMGNKVAQRLQKWSQNGPKIDQRSDRTNIGKSIRKKVDQKTPKGPKRVDEGDRSDPFWTPGRFYPNRRANPPPFPKVAQGSSADTKFRTTQDNPEKTSKMSPKMIQNDIKITQDKEDRRDKQT